MSRKINIKRKKDDSKIGFFDDIESLESLGKSESNESNEALEVGRSSETKDIHKFREDNEDSDENHFRKEINVTESNENIDISEQIESRKVREIYKSPKNPKKTPARRSEPYKTVGIQISLEQIKLLAEYKRKRRMSGDTEFTNRTAIKEALELLFEIESAK